MNHLSKAIALILFLALLPLPAQTQQTSSPAAQPAQPIEQVLIGAYDAAEINGLVFVSGNQTPLEQNFFGLRFIAYRQGDGTEEVARRFEFGPHAPDGSYARVSWQPQFDPKVTITLRWSRVGKRMLAGQLSASANVRVAVEAYRPWSAQDGLSWASYSAQTDRRLILGEQLHNQKKKPPLRRFLWRADRAGVDTANYNDETALRALLTKSDQPAAQWAASRSVITFELAANAPLGFTAAVGDDLDAMQAEAEALMQKPVADLLSKAEGDYEATRALSGGALGDSLEALTRATMWNRFYASGLRYEYVTMNRLSGFSSPAAAQGKSLRGDALGWDSLLAAAMTGLTDGASATAALRILLSGQTPDGRIPLRRYMQTEPAGEPPLLAGRAMPPLGALCTLKVYLATQDLDFLAGSYSRLQQWNDWWLADRGDGQAWRDGNKDSLLEWGFDAELEYGAAGARTLTNADRRRMAFGESGFADRPQWLDTDKTKVDAASPTGAGSPASPAKPREVKYNDQTHTLELTSVALNSLYALDTELMGSISREIGLTTEVDRWQIRYDAMKRLMNEKLWSEEDGLYLDRHWDGQFSRRISLENFYPLIAGIPDEAKAKRMLAVLRNHRKFWGQQLLPSIARDDPDFVEKPSEQILATGATHAAINYLLYLGLKRYGFYEEADGLARQSLDAARAAFEKQGETAGPSGALFDLFASTNGQPIVEARATQSMSFAGLMFLPALEELISPDPWLGLTIGNLGVIEEARVERIKVGGESIDVLISPKRTLVRRGDKTEIEFEAPVRLRGYRSTDRTLTFTVEAKGEVRALVPAAEGRKVTVSINDKVLGSTSPGASATFKVKEGLSKVLIVR